MTKWPFSDCARRTMGIFFWSTKQWNSLYQAPWQTQEMKRWTSLCPDPGDHPSTGRSSDHQGCPRRSDGGSRRCCIRKEEGNAHLLLEEEEGTIGTPRNTSQPNSICAISERAKAEQHLKASNRVCPCVGTGWNTSQNRRASLCSPPHGSESSIPGPHHAGDRYEAMSRQGSRPTRWRMGNACRFSLGLLIPWWKPGWRWVHLVCQMANPFSLQA